MNAVLTPRFGNQRDVRAAAIANAAHERALGFGYSATTAQQLARQAKSEASDWETPAEVALRVVRPRMQSATARGYTPGPSAA